ncbi:MAG: hypothetical protein IJK06_03985 [Clostridia bacterium]|nr:hypothetical protein [Clostridia bacterium]
MKRQWIKSLSVMLLAAVMVITAGILACAGAEEYTDGNGNRFRVVPLGDGRYELWQLVDSVGGNDGGEMTVVDGECQHVHRKWDKGNSQFHWEECLDCGKLFPPTVHVFDQITVVKAATCTQNAVLKRSCVCGLAEEGNSAPVAGEPAEYFAHHTWGTYSSDFLSHWQVCTVCGERGEEQQHTIGNVTVVKEPTCIRDGRVSYDCTVCGAHFDRMEANGLITEKYPVLQQYSALGHDFSGPLKAATGTSKCSQREEGTHAASCTRCGRADYEHKTAHTWAEHTISNGTCEDENDPVIIEGTCECGATLTLKYTRHHEYVKDSSKDIQPTCTEPGKLDGERCLFCGAFGNYEFAQPLGHDWHEDESLRKEPTCLEDGEKHEFCLRCDETRVTPLKSKNTNKQHVFVVHVIKEAKCGEMGWWEKRCKYCDTPWDEGVVFEKIEHDNETTTVEKELDLRKLENGTIVRPVVNTTTIKCRRCGKTRTEVHTVYKAIKGTGFKIVPGNDPGIKDLSDGIHPSGQFSKDPMFFEYEIKRELKKEIDKALEKYKDD